MDFHHLARPRNVSRLERWCSVHASVCVDIFQKLTYKHHSFLMHLSYVLNVIYISMISSASKFRDLA